MLLSFFSSPGTGLTCTVICTGVPNGGGLSSPSVAVAAVPAGTDATFFCTRSGSGPPSILSTTATSTSSFSPWLVKLTVNSVSGP